VDSALCAGSGKFQEKTPFILRKMIMKTMIGIRSPLEHEIMEWAINAELFEDVENGEVLGWSSWDRTGVLTSERLVLDWETPHVAEYAEFILRRLEALEEGARDHYAQVANGLGKRIRHANKGRLSIPRAANLKAAAAHG
jgi:hypothetical protein